MSTLRQYQGLGGWQVYSATIPRSRRVAGLLCDNTKVSGITILFRDSDKVSRGSSSTLRERLVVGGKQSYLARMTRSRE